MTVLKESTTPVSDLSLQNRLHRRRITMRIKVLVVVVLEASAMCGREKLATVAQSIRPENTSSIEPPYLVKVDLRSKVELSPTLLWQGQDTATNIFARVGVQLVWRSGRPRPVSKAERSCSSELVERELALEIAPRAPEFIDENALALAIPHSDRIDRVVIFYDRVQSVFQRHRHGPLGTIFGYILAHEIGHVLQDAPHHSDSGVMRECWTEKDFTKMANGELLFTPQDAALIRKGFALQVSKNCIER